MRSIFTKRTQRWLDLKGTERDLTVRNWLQIKTKVGYVWNFLYHGFNFRLCAILKRTTVKFPFWELQDEPQHEISNSVVSATSKTSDQPAQMIRAFASGLNIL